MPDFLFEIGLEEIPARMIASAEAELARRVTELLTRERLLERAAETPAQTESYATPRRLAVLLRGVLGRQEDTEEQLTGPSWKVAFKDGEPTPAAIAFAKKAGVSIAALEKTTNAKGEYVSARVTKHGRRAAEILIDGLPRELAGIYWAKNMYWRAGKPERFVRPVRWMLMLLDGEMIPVEFGGIRAGKQTFGHRVLHGEAPIEVAAPAAYLPALEAAYVIPSSAARRHRIRKDLDRVTRTVPGARWREDEPLVETVTQLTEWPSVMLGGFEDEYLALPEELLVTVMRDHQKYFAVEDAGGKLLPYFLAVLNTQSDEAGFGVIRHGNERVLRARFNDARFFWNYDQKILLRDRIELLKAVTFQKDLGSYWNKTEANLRLVAAFAQRVVERGVPVDIHALLEATRLAKTDLTSELVKEFTELQGVVGGVYARAQGYSPAVADAIYWQYRPASAEDRVPPTVEGKLLGLADRMATITEMFALGLEPTGSRDPFALRRAANAIVSILASGDVPLSLRELDAMATSPAQNSLAETATSAVASFLRERLSFYLREVRGFRYDVAAAVLAAGADDIPDAVARARALTAVRDSEDFLAISAAFKRIKNILRQAEEKGLTPKIDPLAMGGGHPLLVIAQSLEEDQERELYQVAASLARTVNDLTAQQKYPEALEQIASVRPLIDAFFDKVMVLVPETHLRHNRLALISSLLENFSGIADFSEIVVS